MSKMKIKIWSDIACPYCYIGKRKLEKALSQFRYRENVELEWYSYELDSDLPKKAIDDSIYTYFVQKHGMSETQAHEKMNNLTILAKEVGLDYDFDKLIVANTSNALRLVKLAKEYHLADDAEEVLFEAYFVKGKDVSDRRVLIQSGVQIGLKEEHIITMLDSGIYIDEIKKDMEYSESELALEYIPFYLFNNKQIVQGSIPVEDYLEVLTKAYDEWLQNGTSTEKGEIISGQSCSIDGVCS